MFNDSQLLLGLETGTLDSHLLIKLSSFIVARFTFSVLKDIDMLVKKLIHWQTLGASQNTAVFLDLDWETSN